MRYIYMVTRDVTGAEKGVVYIANLGMHTSHSSADRHFESVKKSREAAGCIVCWDINTPGGPTIGKMQEVRSARIEYNGDTVEHLKIEKWRIR